LRNSGLFYLCVCGMPVEHPTHAEAILQSAVEIIRLLAAQNRFAFTPRPLVEIKGKGPMQMYFVEADKAGS
jgi:hypothetical protein